MLDVVAAISAEFPIILFMIIVAPALLTVYTTRLTTPLTTLLFGEICRRAAVVRA